jgi:hypothetical protein
VELVERSPAACRSNVPPDAVADLNKISRFVLVDSPADPDPVACRAVLTRLTADCVPVPAPVAVRSYIAGPM